MTFVQSLFVNIPSVPIQSAFQKNRFVQLRFPLLLFWNTANTTRQTGIAALNFRHFFHRAKYRAQSHQKVFAKLRPFHVTRRMTVGAELCHLCGFFSFFAPPLIGWTAGPRVYQFSRGAFIPIAIGMPCWWEWHGHWIHDGQCHGMQRHQLIGYGFPWIYI